MTMMMMMKRNLPFLIPRGDAVMMMIKDEVALSSSSYHHVVVKEWDYDMGQRLIVDD
jgi:hypothetical protein